MKITVVLHNIRSFYNVGAILRTCDGLGVEKVVFSGYTPRYEDKTLLPHLRAKLNHQIEKAALGAEKSVPQESLGRVDAGGGDKGSIEDGARSDAGGGEALIKWLECVIMEGYTLVGLENNLSEDEMSQQVILGQNIDHGGQKVDLGEKVVLVLGEEVNGIPAEIRAKMNYFLEIPMCGQKESFNVSVATGIALWGLENCY